MRALAALLAAGAVWLLVGPPIPALRMPDVTLPRRRSIAAALAAGCAMAVVVYAVFQVPAGAVAAGTLAAGIPIGVEAARTRRDRAEIAEAWPDVLARVRTRISSGATIVEAFADGLDGAPQLLRSAGRDIQRSVRFGDGFTAALDRLREELADPIADRVLVAVASTHRSGGRRVGLVLAALSVSVADELRLRRAHEAAMTEVRMTIGVALVAPWALLGLSIASNPQSAEVYRSEAGAAIIAAGLVATSAGFVLARRSARLSDAPRVFQ